MITSATNTGYLKIYSADNRTISMNIHLPPSVVRVICWARQHGALPSVHAEQGIARWVRLSYACQCVQIPLREAGFKQMMGTWWEWRPTVN